MAGSNDRVPVARRLLLVDDNAAERIALARLLETRGFAVSAAADGASALEALRGAVRFDMLLTDMRLPDLDGREVAQQARQLQPQIFVALMTGWDLETEAQGNLSRWGIDRVLMKPIDVSELIARLDAWSASPTAG